MNLLCSAVHAGNTDATLAAQSPTGQQLEYPVNCGSDVVDRIPYYVFAVLMFATTFFQQRQMQNASPPGASSQQQAVLKLMPILFGVFGVFFPAGLVLYWTTSNAWQIGQQYFMLKSRPTAEQMAERAKAKPQKVEKKGFMASMMERAEQQRQQRGSATKPGAQEAGVQPQAGVQPEAGVEPQAGVQPQAGVESEAVRVRRQRQWRRSEEAPQALRRPSRPPSASSA